MLKLQLGVLDIGYVDGDGATTTGDVAGYLEDRYHVMRKFAEMNEDFIADTIADHFAGLIESVAQGKRVSATDMMPVMPKIEERFRDALDSGEIHQSLPAEQQVSESTLKTSSRKKVINQDASRQAFIDSGQYQASFRAWITK